MLSQRLTCTILFGTAVTKTLVVADIAEVMVLVAHVDTNSTNHDQLDARVTVVTVLVYGLPLCHERGRLLTPIKQKIKSELKNVRQTKTGKKISDEVVNFRIQLNEKSSIQ